MALQQPRVGRRRSTTPQHITDVALGLFAYLLVALFNAEDL